MIAGGEAFDESEFEALGVVDGEIAGTANLVERSAQEVFAADRNGECLEDSLDESYCGGAAFDVIDKDASPAGTQDSGHLGECSAVVGDGAEPEGADNGVEGVVVEGQLVRVGPPQGNGTAELVRTAAGDVEHCLTPVNPGQGDVVGIGGEVESGPYGNSSALPAACPHAHSRESPNRWRTKNPIFRSYVRDFLSQCRFQRVHRSSVGIIRSPVLGGGI